MDQDSHEWLINPLGENLIKNFIKMECTSHYRILLVNLNVTKRRIKHSVLFVAMQCEVQVTTYALLLLRKNPKHLI
jgi:hypothetical protein